MASLLPPMGFIAVECYFTRPPGDAWHPKTWPFPIVHQLAAGTDVDRLVTAGEYDDAFINSIVKAAMKLVDQGCVGIITSCGFLAMAQPLLAARLPVPIATSSLIQLPSIFAFLPPSKSVGVLTFDSDRLGRTHFKQLGIDEKLYDRIHISGPPAGGQLQKLVKTAIDYDHAAQESEMVVAARELVARHAEIGALVLECTQMPPFAKAIQGALKIPVYDVYTMAKWFYDGVARARPQYWDD